jgi:hypothetical protein
VSEKGLFLQNIVALIWDFDRTLTPDNMQRPIFEEYGINEAAFWAEVNALPAYYSRVGVTVQADTCYLPHILSYVQHGRMPGLTNAKLRELGAKVKLFPGLPEAFDRLRAVLDADNYRSADLRLEHYIVSTGLEAMIQGSPIAAQVNGVWASGFIEAPAEPGYDAGATPGSGIVSQVAGLLDNTTKTRAIFEINKGVNMNVGISVNDSIPEEERRVPIRNMIYIADGPSDIPSFSVVKRNGGMTLAVYDAESAERLAQADQLHKNGRVHMYGAADYRPKSHTMDWLEIQIREIADRIIGDRTRQTQSTVKKGPRH